jgi:hypothetical protein
MKSILLAVGILLICVSNQDGFYKKKLIDDIYLLIPHTKDLSKDSTYTHIKLYKGQKIIFDDTSLTEYIIDDEFWPFRRKLKDGSIEILIKVFDAPDFDKIHGFYINSDKITSIETFPDFSMELRNSNDQLNSTLSGYMHISEAPCENCDSCYYNPKLYYKLGPKGVYLDSLLTEKENEKRWGKFYGFNLTEKVILPCK